MNDNAKNSVQPDEPLKKETLEDKVALDANEKETPVETKEECGEDSSPALDLSEAADRITSEENEAKDATAEDFQENACEIESSPALDLATVADQETKQEEEQESESGEE